MKKEYCVYILLCSDNSYYTGITSNLENRLYIHNSGIIKNCYTYKRRPLKLVYCESFESIFDAIQAEKRIKKWRRAKKEALIARDFEKLVRLSKRYHPSTGSG